MSGYTESELITHIQELADNLGHPPALRDMKSDPDRPSDSPFRRVFGSWNQALKTAGFDPTASDNNKTYSRTELLNHIQELAEELGHPPSLQDMETAPDRPSDTPFARTFGSWHTALKTAGFSTKTDSLAESPDNAYTRTELLTHINELAEELGHTPSLRDMKQAPDRPSNTPFERIFGSWSKALDAAELPSKDTRPVSTSSSPSSEKILEQIKS